MSTLVLGKIFLDGEVDFEGVFNELDLFGSQDVNLIRPEREHYDHNDKEWKIF
jgi:hypothetical protein